MNPHKWPLALPILLLAFAVVIGLWNVAIVARAQRREREPFRTIIRQSDPSVVLFEHVPTKRCFLAAATGGLLSVERTVCEESEKPIIIVPPPISPEK